MKQKKEVGYFIPTFIATLSLVLYLIFEYSTSVFYKIVAVYLMVTVDLPIIATYLTNLSATVGKKRYK